MNIAQIPAHERPRERLFLRGREALTDVELLAMLLGSGTKGFSALELAREMIRAFGGLPALGRAEVSQLADLHGVGMAKACALAAAMELGRRVYMTNDLRSPIRTAADVYAYYRLRLSHQMREVFYVMCLDNKHRLMRDQCIAEGGIANCSVLPREAYGPAIRESAPTVIFVHNHPSGDPAPSPEDLMLTKRLLHAGMILGVKMLDHVVIGDGGYSSLIDHQVRRCVD